MLVLRSLLALALLAGGLAPAAWAGDAWAELAKPGSIVLFRHATAPGVGDPAGFRLYDCTTQRNLDDKGRAEARKLGDEFRQRKIEVGAVYMSQWCRTKETAQLAFGASLPREEPAFNSFFGQSAAKREAQTHKARQLLDRWTGPGTLVVVTHQVNITALTGEGAASAEGVVVRRGADGRLAVVGTIAP